MESDLDYIIIENQQLQRSDACRQLSCDIIPDTVGVLHCSWLEKCLQEKEKVDTTPYEIKLQDQIIVNSTSTSSPSVTSSSSVTESSKSEGQSADALHETNQPKRQRLSTFEPVDELSMNFPDSELLDNQWRVIYTQIDSKRKPSVLFKFSSGQGRRDVKGVVAFDMDGTLITTKSGSDLSHNDKYV